MSDVNITIERIGHLGDGIARSEAGAVHVPFAAPGDTLARDEASPAGWRIVAEGPHRQAPPCVHYGVCGGCNLQHVSPALYAEAKREWVIAALAAHGIETAVEALVPALPAARRRATFVAAHTRQRLVLGFHPARSHDVIAVPGCQVLRPRIIAALAPVKAILAPRLPKTAEARVKITEAAHSLDVAIEAKGDASPLGAPEMEDALTRLIARITWNGEILLAVDPPRIKLAGVPVDLPPGAFLQATQACEVALTLCVVAGLAKAKRVADLYAGLGTFSFALAAQAAVDAFEGDGALVEAIKSGARRAHGLKPIAAHERDLARRPLDPKELAAYDGVALDPPRAGAEAQARMLARSKVPRVAYVSCFPASFARDARLLSEGGYRLASVTPIDQFLWSHHVELVGRFER